MELIPENNQKKTITALRKNKLLKQYYNKDNEKGEQNLELLLLREKM